MSFRRRTRPGSLSRSLVNVEMALRTPASRYARGRRQYAPRKSVRAVVGNRESLNLHAAECLSKLLHRREDPSVDRHDLREILVGEPERDARWIPGHDDNAIVRHARELGEALGTLGPVVHGQHRQRRREGAVPEWELARRRLHDGRAALRPLADHRERRLDRHHRAITRFVRTGAGADVHRSPGIAEGSGDRTGDSRIGPAILSIRPSDRVIEVRHSPVLRSSRVSLTTVAPQPPRSGGASVKSTTRGWRDNTPRTI